MEDDAGNAARVRGADLVARLKELRQRPQLVILASCQSAGNGDAANPNSASALVSLGPRLAGTGIPAVLAMQGSVSTETVARFMPVFFRELLRDGQIDRAMAVARSAVNDRRDFWMPVLFMRLKSGRIWDASGTGQRTDQPSPALSEPVLRPKRKRVIGAVAGAFILLAMVVVGSFILRPQAQPIVSSINPSYATTDGGVKIDIRGLHLTGANSVALAGVEASAPQLVSDTELTAILPPFSKPSTVDLRVCTPARCSRPLTFTYTAPQKAAADRSQAQPPHPPPAKEPPIVSNAIPQNDPRVPKPYDRGKEDNMWFSGPEVPKAEFVPSEATWNRCYDACVSNPQCRAFMYIKPNETYIGRKGSPITVGPTGICRLKTAVTVPKPDKCCISGFVRDPAR